MSNPFVRRLAVITTCGLLTVTGVAALLAQSAPSPEPAAAPDGPTPPPQPFVHNTPAECSWTITITSKMPANGPDGTVIPVPKSIETVKRNGLKRTVTTRTDGFRQQTWVANGAAYSEFGEKHQINVTDPAHGDPGPPNDKDFPELAWIRKEHYKGIVQVGANQTYFFENPVAKEEGFPGARSVHIDVKTGLPIDSESPKSSYRYQYGAAPAGELALPPAFTELMASHEKAVKAREAYNRTH